MKTYLLAWNPKRWNWKEIAEVASKVASGKEEIVRWSCGKSKGILPGDRVFQIRLGVEKRGIFASGYVIRGSYEDEHWDEEKAKLGEKALFIQGMYDAFLNPNDQAILPIEWLDTPPLSSVNWSTQISGIKINAEAAEKLEELWASFIKQSLISMPEELPNTITFPEGAVHKVTVNSYERNPRARQKCIEHYGAVCSVCGFDFGKVYGEIGVGFIHVHHMRSISEVGEGYQVDPIKDLRPVCPNCHAMIHRREPPYLIEEVRRMLE